MWVCFSVEIRSMIPGSLGFPRWLSGKQNLPADARDTRDVGSILLQYSCLENPMDREAWWVTVHRVAKILTWLSTHTPGSLNNSLPLVAHGYSGGPDHSQAGSNNGASSWHSCSISTLNKDVGVGNESLNLPLIWAFLFLQTFWGFLRQTRAFSKPYSKILLSWILEFIPINLRTWCVGTWLLSLWEMVIFKAMKVFSISILIRNGNLHSSERHCVPSPLCLRPGAGGCRGDMLPERGKRERELTLRPWPVGPGGQPLFGSSLVLASGLLDVPLGLPWWLISKESTCNVGNLGLITGLEDPLEDAMATHSSILAWRISMNKGAWRVTVHGVAKSRTRLRDKAHESVSVRCVQLFA